MNVANLFVMPRLQGKCICRALSGLSRLFVATFSSYNSRRTSPSPHELSRDTHEHSVVFAVTLEWDEREGGEKCIT
jgi:hypothetical protein